MAIKVSIIVPCWGVEKYLDRCVESLVNQTLKDIEIILVDDLSPDRVPEMCDEWAKKDDRIIVVHKTTNEGLGMARNTGLEYARGEYVMFVDSDDSIKLDSCERFYNSAKKYNSDIVTGNFITEYLPGKWHEEEQTEGRVALTDSEEIRTYMLDVISGAPFSKKERLYPVSVCLLFVKRIIIKNNNLVFNSERIVASEDTLFKVSLLKSAKSLVREPYNFYYYHLNNCSLTHSFKNDVFDKINNLKSCLDSIFENDNEAIMRVRRFVSSEHRMQILRLMNTNNKNKLQTIRTYLNNPVWKDLAKFKPLYFPMYSCIFHQLCLWNMPILVYAYAAFINFVKQRHNY